MNSSKSATAPATDNGATEKKGEKPAFSGRFGPGLSYGVWTEVDREGRIRFSVRIEKSFVGRDGERVRSHLHLFPNELPHLAELATRAWTECELARQQFYENRNVRDEAPVEEAAQ